MFFELISFSSVFFSILLRVNVESAVNILSSTSTSFGASSASNIDEKLQRQLLAEEEQAMQKYKVGVKWVQCALSSYLVFNSNCDEWLQAGALIFLSLSLQDGAKATNPFASDAPAAPAPADNSNTSNILDLFGMQDGPATASEVGVVVQLLKPRQADIPIRSLLYKPLRLKRCQVSNVCYA